MTIRKMREEDYEDIYALWLSCPGMGLNSLDDSKEGIAAFLKRNPETCLVAVEDKGEEKNTREQEEGEGKNTREPEEGEGKKHRPAETEEKKKTIVGTILVGCDGRRAHIYHAAVHPLFQRRGIGRALVEEAMKAVRREGIHKVCLVAFEKNREGNAFWERMGFGLREDLSYRDRLLGEGMVKVET